MSETIARPRTIGLRTIGLGISNYRTAYGIIIYSLLISLLITYQRLPLLYSVTLQ